MANLAQKFGVKCTTMKHRPLQLGWVLLLFAWGPVSEAHNIEDRAIATDRHSFASAVQRAQQDLHHRMPFYFPEIRRIAEQIRPSGPFPEHHLLIGVGRGPSVFLTYLKLAFPSLADHVLEVPFSSFQRHWEKRGPDFTKIKRSEEIFLQKYFAKFLAPHLTPDLKTITLIDYAQTGATLFTFTAWLQRFVKEHLPALAHVKWHMIAIAYWPLHPRFMENLHHFALAAPQIIPLPKSSLLGDPFVGHYFDQFAPFQEYPIDEYANWNALKSWFTKYLPGHNFSLEIPPRSLPNEAFYQVLLQELKLVMPPIPPPSCPALLQKPTR